MLGIDPLPNDPFFKSDGMIFDWQSKLPWMLLGLSGTLLALTIVMLGGPAWVYAGNADEFTASALQILGIYLPYLIGILAIGLVLLALLPRVLARPLALLLAAIAAAAWVQGTFMVADFGSLDGRSWSIEAPVWRVMLELVALVLAMMMAGLIASRAPMITAALMAILAVAAVAEPVSRLPDKPALTEIAETPALFEFSPEKNLLIVLLDGMQSEIFDDVTKESPEILAALDGFTYYPDTAGVAHTTVLTMPVIHTGDEYEAGKPIKEYYAETVSERSFMNELTDAGYRTELINPIYGICPSDISLCIRAKVVLTSVQSTIVSEANKLLSIGIFRAVPLSLKTFVYNRGRWRKLISPNDPRTAHHTVEGNSFMEDVALKASLDATEPTVKFFHLASTHLPVAVNEECVYIGKQKSTRDGFKQQAKCAMTAFAGLVNGLKERGILDQTAIVLLSDHGSGGWKSSRGIDTDLVRSNLLAVANPTLAIKPFNATGPMQSDNAQLSLADVPGTICALIVDCSIERPAKDRQIRQFRDYQWDGTAWAENTPIDITSYHIAGPVFDGRTWTKAPF